MQTRKCNKLEHELLDNLVFIYYSLFPLTKYLRTKDMEPIALDMIDPKYIWSTEDESLGDLCYLRSQPKYLWNTSIWHTWHDLVLFKIKHPCNLGSWVINLLLTCRKSAFPENGKGIGRKSWLTRLLTVDPSLIFSHSSPL